MTSQTGLRMAYFGHNRRDTAFVRRVRGFLDAGTDITTLTFRRDGEPATPGPDWPNVDLGHLEHGRFVQRIWFYLKAVRAVFAARKTLAKVDVIYARNLDIFLFAWLTVVLSTFGRRPTFVYECLDVHEALIGSGFKARLLRAAERRVLKRSALLVVSSPGFIHEFFKPVQGYDGPWHWIENKLYLRDHVVPRPTGSQSADAPSKPLTIGWVGIIRCQQTLDLLCAVARSMPDAVRIRITGLVSYFLIPDFDATIADLDNIEFRGPYEWPSGLADAYRDTDLVWAQELSWSGGNSDWLIPNRVYEASYFGVPSLAIGSTQTGRIVEERELGFVLAKPDPELLERFIQSVSAQELNAAKQRLLGMSDAAFVLQPADTTQLLDAIRSAASA